jgi:transposase
MYPLIFRERAVRGHLTLGYSLKQVSTFMGIGKSTLCRWLQNMVPARRACKYDAALVDFFVQSELNSQPFCTLGALARKLRAAHNIKLSRSKLHGIVSAKGFSRLKARRQVQYEGKSEARRRFVSAVRELAMENVVSIDEASVYIDDMPRVGWGVRGKRLVLNLGRQARKPRRVTLLMAVGCNGVVGWKTLDGSANTAVFSEFIESLGDLQGKTIIMDNVAFHKSNVVSQAVSKAGAKTMFTPPYSPCCNPIEMGFSVIKQAYRARWREGTSVAQRMHDLRDSIADTLTPALCTAFISHVAFSLQTA